MKKKLSRSVGRGLVVLLMGFGSFSCKEVLEVQPDNVLEANKFYQNKFDADAAVIGIYGEFMNLADRYVILNELRADLLDVTANADDNLVQLSRHSVRPGNPYADPKPFYKVILLCNDALKNFDIMLAENKMDQLEYSQRYSDIAALRTFLYMQLMLHYGQVPYITEPFVKLADVQNLDRFPRFTIEQMVPELIKVLENLPWQEDYSTTNSLVAPIDNYATAKFFIPKKLLLADLYLWSGNYLEAAKIYKAFIDPGNFSQYKIAFTQVLAGVQDLTVQYIRFRDDDAFSLVDDPMDGWRSIFNRPVDNLFNAEWIWYAAFDSRFAPKNPFIDLFSNWGGRYLVKPSQSVMDMWDAQVQRNGIQGDARKRFTVRTEKGEPVIYKYIYNYDPVNPLNTNGKWWLMRAAQVHLHLAEAANHDNKRKLALALLNNGISANFNNGNPDVRENFDTFYEFPYDFAARSSNAPYNFRDPYHQHTGIRGRGYVSNRTVAANLAVQDSINTIDNYLIDEAALELAFEGQRWGDLLRIAVRRNDPAFLADKIYAKLEKAGDPRAAEVRQRLMNRDNWFLPFRWE
jgi:starch-binding outer membrane protein, SusD/RagB family